MKMNKSSFLPENSRIRRNIRTLPEIPFEENDKIPLQKIFFIV